MPMQLESRLRDHKNETAAIMAKIFCKLARWPQLCPPKRNHPPLGHRRHCEKHAHHIRLCEDSITFVRLRSTEATKHRSTEVRIGHGT